VLAVLATGKASTGLGCILTFISTAFARADFTEPATSVFGLTRSEDRLTKKTSSKEGRAGDEHKEQRRLTVNG